MQVLQDGVCRIKSTLHLRMLSAHRFQNEKFKSPRPPSPLGHTHPCGNIIEGVLQARKMGMGRKGMRRM